MKFSIVVPVYNVEKYLDKCLDSLLNQTYKDFEVIIVNDGTKDNSQTIIDRYVEMDSRFKSYIKENGGLSDARNYGVKKATGDYLLFLDSDDYLDYQLLDEINSVASGYDIIKFNMNIVNEAYEIIKKGDSFKVEGNASIKQLINSSYFQPATIYAYSLKFWNSNKFEFPVDRIHEDFGTTPYVVSLAKNIYMLNFYGYNYLQREGSIMNGGIKALKRANDMLYHFDFLIKKIEPLNNISEEGKRYLLSFIANNTIVIIKILNKEDMSNFIGELKKRNIYKYVLDDSFIRKVKKYIIKLNLSLYIKLFVK